MMAALLCEQLVLTVAANGDVSCRPLAPAVPLKVTMQVRAWRRAPGEAFPGRLSQV